MADHFDHEKLDVYRVSIELVGWVHQTAAGLSGTTRNARDQLIRAAESIPLNIAEGTGKRPGRDCRRFYEMARASAVESAAALDVLVATGVRSVDEVRAGKAMLLRIVQMLIRLSPPDGRAA